ncbi:MAG: hypothetical protein ACFBSG_15020 [Leptolyngbyaceae cyanobacterium]
MITRDPYGSRLSDYRHPPEEYQLEDQRIDLMTAMAVIRRSSHLLTKSQREELRKLIEE